MSLVIPAKDRAVFWAWVAWKDALKKNPAAPKPPIVVAWLKTHYKIPALWWTRYAIHVGTPVNPPKPPVEVPTRLEQHVQNIIFGAQEPLTALGAPAKFGVALSADPAYAAWATPSVVAALRYAGHRVYAWGNQVEIPAAWIQKLSADLKLDGCIYQSETEAELVAGFAAGGQLFVGNPNSWPDRIAAWNTLAEAGKVAMTFEVYTNEGAPWPETASAAGALVASECIGVYATAHGDPQIADYKQHTPPGIWATICVYHAAGVTGGWGAL